MRLATIRPFWLTLAMSFALLCLTAPGASAAPPLSHEGLPGNVLRLGNAASSEYEIVRDAIAAGHVQLLNGRNGSQAQVNALLNTARLAVDRAVRQASLNFGDDLAYLENLLSGGATNQQLLQFENLYDTVTTEIERQGAQGKSHLLSFSRGARQTAPVAADLVGTYDVEVDLGQGQFLGGTVATLTLNPDFTVSGRFFLSEAETHLSRFAAGALRNTFSAQSIPLRAFRWYTTPGRLNIVGPHSFASIVLVDGRLNSFNTTGLNLLPESVSFFSDYYLNDVNVNANRFGFQRARQETTLWNLRFTKR